MLQQEYIIYDIILIIKIVEKKYGNEAGDLSKEGFEVVGNVGQITRAYKDAAAKAIIQETDKKDNNK